MFYDIFRTIGLIVGYPLQLIFFKRRTFYENGVKRKVKKGGKLIISNHYNMFDYVLTSFIVFPRKLSAVASEMPFKSKMLRFLMKFFGAIQANRVTRDMRFMDECAGVIKKGQLVIIYPEGRNTPDGKMHEFKKSYLVIAHRAKSKILPMVTDGNYGLFKRTSVMIGEEIDVSNFFTTDKPLPDKQELENANQVVYQKMLELQVKLEEEKAKRRRKKKC